MEGMWFSVSALGWFLAHSWLGDLILPLPKGENRALVGREFSPVPSVSASLPAGVSCRRSPVTPGEALGLRGLGPESGGARLGEKLP